MGLGFSSFQGKSLVVAVSFSIALAACSSKYEKFSENQSPRGSVDGEFLVKLRDRRQLESLGLRAQLAKEGVEFISIQASANLFKIRVKNANGSTFMDSLLAQLNTSPDVEYVEPNVVYHILGIRDGFKTPKISLQVSSSHSDPLLPEQWGLSQSHILHILAKHQPDPSKKILVAVLDTGIDLQHPDLKDIIEPNGWNIIRNNSDVGDDYGHGTHVAGILGAVSGNGIGISGAAANIRILPIKFIDRNGGGTLENAIKAIRYARKMKVQIINASWASPIFSAALRDEIRAAKAEGITFVAAAGNEGADNDFTPSYPANYKSDNIISVAGTDSEDHLWSSFSGHSNYGVKTVHVAAPGAEIMSTYRGSSYYSMSGTSMAAPLISAIVARMLLENSQLTPEEIRQRLVQTSDPLPELQDKVISGGRVNAYRAVYGL
jgi:hypothetical protein